MPAKTGKPPVISRQVLADHVYQEVLVALMDGRLEAGRGISIDGLARDLDVSPTPVREALARLEATGMVRRVALKGYRVAPLFSSEDLAELMDARLVIEPVNALRACERRTPELNQALEQSITDLKNAPRGASFAEFRDYWEADERFHQLIAENAGNQFILSAFNSLGGQIQRFRFFSGLGVTDAECAIEEHAAILQAFAAGNPALAQEAMVAHLTGVKKRALLDVVEHA
ncbi:GntR family transcriptional regulator [Paenarthrobacter sp. Z7-10]|uniref:GntR family transcriptional regulator n=1 Tax=Paenarthrobacter sp. Z7-10 TaxID=2787635 RepID=UPI0022A9BF8E|nr:GntR family transcriptional regulator [Paenarthrobacter sp. Z7-10]MCZ2403787.1 GntR family transcriptional regulator [Paenarthrobacter sp. Z7-10]